MHLPSAIGVSLYATAAETQPEKGPFMTNNPDSGHFSSRARGIKRSETAAMRLDGCTGPSASSGYSTGGVYACLDGLTGKYVHFWVATTCLAGRYFRPGLAQPEGTSLSSHQ